MNNKQPYTRKIWYIPIITSDGIHVLKEHKNLQGTHYEANIQYEDDHEHDGFK